MVDRVRIGSDGKGLANHPLVTSVRGSRVLTGKRRLVIVLDVDGTLLRSDQSISTRLVAALQRVRQAGHQPIIATGRRRKTARAVARLLGLPNDVPLVVCDGAVAFRSAADVQPIAAHPLPREAVEKAVAVARRHGVGLVFYTADDIYTSDLRLTRLVGNLTRRIARVGFAGLSVALQDLYHRPRRFALGSPAGLPFPIYKGLFREDDPSLREQMAGLVQFTMPPGHGNEFVSVGVTKATGVGALLKALGADWSQVVAFGDNWNDLALLETARFGFLMGNAPEDLKARHPYQIATADEDGVAQVLEQLESVVEERERRLHQGR